MFNPVKLFIFLILLLSVGTIADHANKKSQRKDRASTNQELHTKSAEVISQTGLCPLQSVPGPAGVQGIQGIQGVQGVQGQVGPVGPAGLPGHNGGKGAKGEKGQRGRKGDTAFIDNNVLSKFFPKIAFSVALDHDIEPSNEYRVIKYNIQLLNDGNAYSFDTGIFTSQENGTFIIGFAGVSSHGHNVLLHLVRNGQRILSAFDNSGCACCPKGEDLKKLECAGSASNVAILPLIEGDKLWVELPDQYGLHNAPYHNYATFYGHLLYVF